MSYAEKDKAARLEDCGQSGVCELSPGCVRHFIERNAELVKERAALCNEIIRLKAECDNSKEAIRLILEADCLRPHAYERGDDDASIYELCRHVLGKA